MLLEPSESMKAFHIIYACRTQQLFDCTYLLFINLYTRILTTNPRNTSLSVEVGSCTWRCLHQIYNRTKSVLRASSPQVLVSSWYTLIRLIPNPKIICENGFSRYHLKTRHSWPSKRVNVVRKHFHFIKISFWGWTWPFWRTWSLGLRQVQSILSMKI